MEKTKQIPYRAIALDLDGTLTNHEKVVTPKTREALLQASAKGAVIILASGRYLRHRTGGRMPGAEQAGRIHSFL